MTGLISSPLLLRFRKIYPLKTVKYWILWWFDNIGRGTILIFFGSGWISLGTILWLGIGKSFVESFVRIQIIENLNMLSFFLSIAVNYICIRSQGWRKSKRYFLLSEALSPAVHRWHKLAIMSTLSGFNKIMLDYKGTAHRQSPPRKAFEKWISN